ncbi:hypothetical protein NGM10_03040 [Halorussus salilacus]|uniref:DUF7321 family protein n=1 Tax=Halorussus salilacus TaxID=2953750 RepID=UPI0020A146A6|nr:hypothetical protein [Halorussus salilacus]USZ68721.1 hypothetical protein NGM10_03040 [Halorussus salilacus]
MVSDAIVATVVALVVTASLPFYLYGAWYILDQETVTWGVLTHHLKFIAVGLLLTAVPVVTWMAPRFFEQVGGLTAVHVFLGLQAYAMLTLALTGIVRIFQVKYHHDLYHDPDENADIDDLHENMGAWRRRLRVGVAGYVVFWLLAWVVGIARYFVEYVLY